MSKYKVEFSVGTNYVGSDHREEFDLVDDWGWDEEDAKKSLGEYGDEGSNKKLEEVFNEWVLENIDAGLTIIEEGE